VNFSKPVNAVAAKQIHGESNPSFPSTKAAGRDRGL
jgi:hypothetical protein